MRSKHCVDWNPPPTPQAQVCRFSFPHLIPEVETYQLSETKSLQFLTRWFLITVTYPTMTLRSTAFAFSTTQYFISNYQNFKAWLRQSCTSIHPAAMLFRQNERKSQKCPLNRLSTFLLSCFRVPLAWMTLQYCSLWGKKRLFPWCC